MKIDRCIINNFNKGKYIEKLISKENNTEERIRLLQILACYYSNHVTGLYSSEFLENQLIKLSQLIKMPDITEIKEEKNTVLHVMTIPYNVGGHTRVVDNWINFDHDRKYSVFINEPRNAEIPIWLKESVEKSGGSIILNQHENIIEKAKFLVKSAIKYEKVVLHIHNWDIVPLIAFANSSWKKPIFLYNHSDHKFWVGTSIADMVLDLTSDGMKMSVKKRGTKNNYVLPIPIISKKVELSKKAEKDGKSNIKYRLGLPLDSRVILSMASDYKYVGVSGYDFEEFAKKLIDINPNIYFLIIGANKKSSRWIKLKKTSKGRIRAQGLINKELISEYMEIADVYIDSFPMNSYTCLLEAINYNIPSLSLKTPISDLDVLKDIKFDSEYDMIYKITEILTTKDHLTYMNEIRDKVAKKHYKDNWHKNLNILFDIEIKHSVKINEIEDSKITNYERFMYELHKKYEGFPIKHFIKLSFSNKIKILFVCRKDFFVSLKNFIIKFFHY